MLESISQAFNALTILKFKSKNIELKGINLAYYYICFPIVGLFFGILSYLIVISLGGQSPFFVAWFLPLFLIFITGGNHFISLGRFFNNVIFDSNLPNANKDWASIGFSVAVFFNFGKSLAILEGKNMGFNTLAILLLLTPVVSRYISVLLAISTHKSRDKYFYISLGGSTLILLLVCSISIFMSLVLFISAACLAIIIRELSNKKLSELKSYSLGALVEASEVVIIWIAILINNQYMSLTMFNLKF